MELLTKSKSKINLDLQHDLRNAKAIDKAVSMEEKGETVQHFDKYQNAFKSLKLKVDRDQGKRAVNPENQNLRKELKEIVIHIDERIGKLSAQKECKEKNWKTVKWIGGAAALVLIGILAFHYFSQPLPPPPPPPPPEPPEEPDIDEIFEPPVDTRWPTFDEMINNLQGLQELAEDDLHEATKYVPGTFEILNLLRIRGEIPSYLKSILKAYKISTAAENSIPGYQANNFSIDPEIQKRIKEARQILTLAKRSPIQEEIDFTRIHLENDFRLYELVMRNPPAEFDKAAAVSNLEKSLSHLEEEIRKANFDVASIREAAGVLRPPEVLSSLINSPPEPIDDRLFQHILGDYWGKNTGLEGYNAGNMLKYILKNFQRQIEVLENNPHCTEADKSALCQSIAGIQYKDLPVYANIKRHLELGVHLSNEFEKGPKKLRQAIESAIQALKPHESRMFMGGWVGHAIVYEIEKEEDGRFIFRLSNRGDGAEYHAWGLKGEKLHGTAFFEIRGTTREHLLDPVFLKGLTEMRDSPPQTSEKWNGEDLYAGVLSALEGSLEIKNFRPETAMEELRVGHCTFLSLTGFIHRLMKDSYGRPIIDLQFKTLWDYYQMISGSLHSDKFRRDLLKMGSAQLSHNADEAFEKNLLSSDELRYLKNHLKEIDALILWAEMNPKPFKFSIATSPLKPLQGEFSPINTFDFQHAASSPKGFYINVLSFEPNLQKFEVDCKTWRSLFAMGNREGHYAMTKEAIKDWVRMIPIDWLEKPKEIEAALTKERAETVLSELAEIAKDFAFSQVSLGIQDPSRHQYVEPSDFFTVVKLLTLGDFLGRSAKVTGGDLPGLYQMDMDLLLEGSSGHSMLLDPELEDQIGRLRTYWQKIDPPQHRSSRDDLSFFGIEASPFCAGYARRKFHNEHSLSCAPPFNWPYFAWAAKYIERPEIQHEIQKQNPLLSKQTLIFQTTAALHETMNAFDDVEFSFKKIVENLAKTPRKFLPKPFYALWDLSLAVDLILHPGKPKTSTHPNRKDGIKTECYLERDAKCGIHKWISQITPFDLDWEPDDPKEAVYAWKDRYKYSENTPGSKTTDANRFLQNGQDRLGIYSSLFEKKRWIFPHEGEGKSMERLRIGPNLRAHFPSEKLEKWMDREQIDELLSLSGVRDLAIVQTLGHFKNRLPLFEKRDAQTLFFNLMAEPPLLVEQLRRGKELFAKELSDFVREGYEFFEKLNNPEVSLYFLDLNRYFRNSVAYVLPSSDAPFLDSRKILKAKISQESDPEIKSALWLDLASELSPKHLRSDEAADLLSAYAYSHLHPVGPNHPFVFLSETTARIGRLSRFQGALKRILSSTAKTEILNAVLKAVFGIDPKSIWKENPEFPLFKTQDGQYSFDVSTGKIYQEKEEIVLLPTRFRDLPILKPFLGPEKMAMVRQAGPDRFEWRAPDGLSIRIAETKNGLKIQREIKEGLFAELTAPPEKFPVLKGVLLKKDLWVEVGHGAQKYWISDPSTGKLLYKAEKSSHPNIYTVSQMEKKWALGVLPKKSVFRQLDEDEYVLAWLDEKKKPVAIEAPRLGLSFEIKEEEVRFPKLPGYFLSAIQPNPIVQFYGGAIALENKEGKQKILFPNPMYLRIPKFQDPEKNCFLFDLKEGALQPLTSEDRLFLAFRELQAKEYQKAHDSLGKYRSQLRKLRDQERSLLQVIVSPEDGGFEDRDLSPSSLAIRMKALSLLNRDRWDFAGPDFDLKESGESLKIINRYVQYLDQTPTPWKLPLKEEEWLLRTLPIKDDPLLERRLKGLLSGNTDYSTLGLPGKKIQPNWEPVQKLLDMNSLDLRDLGNIPIPSNHALLRRTGLASNFQRFYKVARQTPNIDSYRNWVEDLMGEKPDPALRLNDLRKTIENGLKMIARSRTQTIERTAAVLLLAVLNNPADFSQADELVSMRSNVVNNQYVCSSVLINPALPYLNRLMQEISWSDAKWIPAGQAEPPRSNQPKSQTPCSPLQFGGPQEENFAQNIEELKKEIGDLHKKIIKLSNKEFPSLKEQTLRQLKKISGFEKPLGFQEIALAFLRSDPGQLQESNPALTCDEARIILDETRNYLLLATRYQKEERILGLKAKIEKLTQERTPQEEIDMVREEVNLAENNKRTYKIEEHPEYLIFEYAKNLELRPLQVENLEKMVDGTALEMIMGAGKTTVLLPLLALYRADGKTLSMLVMPETLIPSVSDTLDKTLGSAFSKAIELFEFDRNTPLDKPHLERILDRMRLSIKERKAVLISSSSLQSLVLRFIESLRENNEKTATFKEIVSLIRSSTALTLDEMDLLLDVLKAHYFTQGMPSKISEDTLDAVTHIYRLLTDSSLKGRIKWNFLESGAIPLTKESYEKFMADLAHELLKPSIEHDQELNGFLSALTEEEKIKLRKYFYQKKKTDPEAIRFVKSIQSQRIKNILAIWKEETSRILFLTGKKQVFEHYGPDPRGSVMAIPYQSSNKPMIGSQHGTDLEILNYAYQMYLAQDLKKETIQKEIEFLKSEVVQELAGNPNLKKIEETKAYQKFLRLTGRKTYSLYFLTNPQMNEILERVNRDNSIKIGLIRKHLLPKIEEYSRLLHMNAHMLETLSKESSGFSGTLWNAQSFPLSYWNKIPSNTEEATLKILIEKLSPLSVISQAANLENQVRELYRTHRGSLADLGGIFRGVDPENVVSAIIDLSIWENTKIKGIAFYNTYNEKKVRIRGQKESIPFDESPLSKEEIIAYWAQKDITGCDIPLAHDMHAIVTVSQHTMTRDLLQAVWRLRELHRKQSVEFSILKEDAGVMGEVLKASGKSLDQELSLQDLIDFVKVNEKGRQGEDNLRALKYKLLNVLIEPIWNILLDPNQNQAAIPDAVEDLFYKNKPKNAFDIYGDVQETGSTNQAIEDEIKDLKKNRALNLLSNAQQEEIFKKWEKIIQSELPHLPSETYRPLRYDTQAEVQIETKVEVKTETKTETMQQVELDPNLPERAVFLWKEPNLFKKRYFFPSASLQDPDETRFPQGSLALPDFERVQKIAHPMDHLNVEGEDLLAKNNIRPLAKFGRGTDPNLLLSWNAILNQKTKYALLIRYRESHKIRLMALSPWDALMFQRLLEKDRQSPQKGDREIDLALYHFDLDNIVSQGSHPIDPASLKTSEDFATLKAQIKFFNGNTDYNAKESESLKRWIEKEGSKKLKDLFVNEILKNKPTSAARFPKSTLAALFSAGE